MKTGKLLLLLACLLIALQTTAAAYEPTNGAALGSSFDAIKITVKEEVVISPCAIGERSAIPAVPIPAVAAAPEGVINKLLGVYLITSGPAGGYVKKWRDDRVCSRFT